MQGPSNPVQWPFQAQKDSFKSQSLDPTDYQYRPLDPPRHEIRVIDLRSGNATDAIQCSIRHVFINERPLFETISYVWGDETIRDVIYVDCKRLSVPASSAAALRKVRYEDKGRTVWIDAVCIDQRNTDERNHQVALMRKVFSQAWQNNIYLGEAEPAISARAETLIKQLLLDLEEETGGYAKFLTRLVDSQGYPTFSSIPFHQEIDFDIAITVASLPWFNRVWVMQEAALAKYNLCYYGSYQVTLVDMVVAFLWLYHKRSFIPSILFAYPALHNSVAVCDCISQVEGIYYEHPDKRSAHRTAVQAIIFGSTLASKDAKDHVFGVLGMMNCTGVDIPSKLSPDYEKTDLAVFQDATSYAIEEDGIEKVFRYIRHRSEEEVSDAQWVSWVPKWSRAMDRAEDSSILSYEFTAAKAAPRSTEVDGKTLRTFGITIDSVRHSCQTFTEGCFAKVDELQAILAEVQEKCRLSVCSRDNDQGKQTCILVAKTLLAGVDCYGRPLSDEETQGYNDFCKFVVKHGKLPPYTNRITDEASKASRFASALNNAACNRRFLLTAEGKCALGPNVTRDGDVIVVLEGGPTPYVLRPWKGKYKILGECYVEGIMYGEAMREQKASARPREMFEIR